MFSDRLAKAAAVSQAVLVDRMAGFGDLPVAQGMRYAVAGGKGLRGFFVIESAALFGISGDAPAQAAAGIEALHAYSLVHDDLPCMDDDDLRRGQPTVHRKWDEATAVLVGDALQTLAFELVADTRSLPLVTGLAKAAGVQGMVLGQAQDMAAETAENALDLAAITELQRNKTGALIEWSATAGAVLAGQDDTPLRQYAQAVGLAFQIADDILDIEGDAETVGKATGKDADAGKATFVSLLGLDTAKARAQSLVDTACDALAIFGDDAKILQDAAQFVVSRNK